MDITITGRNITISDRFRDFVSQKSERIDHLDKAVDRLEVMVSRHSDPTGTRHDDRVELTIRGHAQVIRAESGAADKYSAFDVAIDKLIERVRRAKDKRKIHRSKQHHLTSLGEAVDQGFSDVALTPITGPLTLITDDGADIDVEDTENDSPIVIREKSFPAAHMTASEAVDHMELVGHDFFLYVDSETQAPSVVYRRKGWNYGGIRLES